MRDELNALYVQVMVEDQYKDTALAKAVMLLLNREIAREDAEQADYERRMMEP